MSSLREKHPSQHGTAIAKAWVQKPDGCVHAQAQLPQVQGHGSAKENGQRKETEVWCSPVELKVSELVGWGRTEAQVLGPVFSLSVFDSKGETQL